MRFPLILVSIIIILISGCNQGTVPENKCKSLDYKDENILWDNVMKKYLNDPLWIERDIYDAGHNLMIPLHASFKRGNKQWVSDFDLHFKRFLAEYKVDNNISLLNKLQYYYVVSRYLTLLVDYDYPIEEHHYQLAEMLREEIAKNWQTEPAWHWSHENFTGMKKRLDYKLNLKNPRFSYDKAIIDEELFLISIASDLKYFFEMQQMEDKNLKEINLYGQRVFLEEGELLEGGGWVFQKNVWRDHPDYAFTRYQSVAEITTDKPKISDEVYIDSSHGTRFPIQIYSVMKAASDEIDKLKLKTIYENLEIQFYEKILIKHKSKEVYLLNNFMDGSNGVFRFNYVTNKGTGYGKYELSGILMIGWYDFLNTERVSKVFKEMADNFPIDETLYNNYYADKTNRERHPLATAHESYYGGLDQLILLLASEPLLK